MNPTVLLTIQIILGLFTFFGAAGFIVGITNWVRKQGGLEGIPLGLAGLIVGLGGFFIITR